MSTSISTVSAAITALNTVLHYYTEFKLLLCAECQISVQSSQLLQYIKSHLIAIKAEKDVYQSVIQHYSQLELSSHNNVILQLLQTQSLSAFSELRTYSHAFQCTVSDWRKVFLSRQNIVRHA